MKKVLFLLENTDDFKTNPEYMYDRFVKYSLAQAGIGSEIRLVTDVEEIVRALQEYEPTHVVMPALWLEPEVFESIHVASIIWILRIPKTAETSRTLDQSAAWLNGYIQCKNTLVSCNNNKEFLDNIRDTLQDVNDYTADEIAEKILSCDTVMTTILK